MAVQCASTVRDRALHATLQVLLDFALILVGLDFKLNSLNIIFFPNSR